MTCPNCGQPLTDTPNGHPAWPPYQCLACSRGWWPAEVTKRSRDAWDPTTRCFTKSGMAAMKSIEEAVNDDLDAQEEEED